MSTPPAQVSELAIEVKGCETVVLTIQATPVSTPEPTQRGTGLGRIEITLVDNSQPCPKPITAISSVFLRPHGSPSRVIPVAIATSGDAAGTGVADNVPAGQYIIELLPVIYFKVGTPATWLPSEKGKLDTMAELLNNLGDRGVFSLFIAGHASVEGDKKLNDSLSRERAVAVKEWLKSRINPKVSGRIDMLPEGKGAPSGKQEVDPLDRRVDFVLVPARGT